MGLSGINPTNLIAGGLQEASTTAATFLVISAATGQAASQAAHGVRHLIDGSPAFAFAASSNKGQAFGHASHGVLHLIDRSFAFAAQGVPNNGHAFGHAAHGVRHLIDGSPASVFLSLLSLFSLLLFPSL